MAPARSQVMYLLAVICLVVGLSLPFARFRKPLLYGTKAQSINTADLSFKLTGGFVITIAVFGGLAITGFWRVWPTLTMVGGAGIICTVVFVQLKLSSLALQWLILRLNADPRDYKILESVARSAEITNGFLVLFLCGLIFIICGRSLLKESTPEASPPPLVVR